MLQAIGIKALRVIPLVFVFWGPLVTSVPGANASVHSVLTAVMGRAVQAAGPRIPPPNHDPQCMQKCFDDYTANIERCREANTHQVLWFLITKLDEVGFRQCARNAQEVFEACKKGCEVIQA